MLIQPKLIDGLNAQIGREYGAFLQYAAMAAWCEEQGLHSLSVFFFKQSDEESQHGRKLVQYLCDVGGAVSIPALPKPKTDYPSVEAALKHFLEMEKEVTRAIFALVELAQAEKDHSTYEFLQWYVAEQREEVASASHLLQTAQKFGEDRILLMDQLLEKS
jgi:ferritin